MGTTKTGAKDVRADVWTLQVFIVSKENALWWKHSVKKRGRLLPPESEDANTDDALTMHVCKQSFTASPCQHASGERKIVNRAENQKPRFDVRDPDFKSAAGGKKTGGETQTD